MYTNEHAAALLLAFTPDQRRAIYHLTKSSVDPERDVEIAQSAAPAVTPIFRLVDIGSIITPAMIGNWQAGMSMMFASLFTKVWTPDEVRTIIERGARIKGDYAQQIADRVVSPDTDLTDFAYRILSTAADLPFVPSRLKAFTPVLGAAFSFLYSTLGSKDFAADNSATMLRLGKEVNNLAVETLLSAAEASYEARLSPQTLDSFGDTMQRVWQWLWGQNPGAASPLGLPSGEAGDVIYAPDAAGFAQMQQAARQLSRAYEEGDPDAAAELGFIVDLAEGLGRGAAAIGKNVSRRVRKRRAKRRARHKQPKRADAQLIGQLRSRISAMGLNPNDRGDLSIGLTRLLGASSMPAGPLASGSSNAFPGGGYVSEDGDPDDADEDEDEEGDLQFFDGHDEDGDPDSDDEDGDVDDDEGDEDGDVDDDDDSGDEQGDSDEDD